MAVPHLTAAAGIAEARDGGGGGAVWEDGPEQPAKTISAASVAGPASLGLQRLFKIACLFNVREIGRTRKMD